MFIFGYFRPGHVWPKYGFARFSLTVYTGGSSTGRKVDAAEMGLALGGRNLKGLKMCPLTVRV